MSLRKVYKKCQTSFQFCGQRNHSEADQAQWVNMSHDAPRGVWAMSVDSGQPEDMWMWMSKGGPLENVER